MTRSIKKIVDKYSNKSLNSFQIYQELDKECSRLKNQNIRDFKESEYLNAAKEVIWLIRTSTKPSQLNSDSLIALKPLAEELIENGHMEKKAIDIFELDT